MPVRREDIAASLRDRIVSGEYRPGTKLPSYRALIAEFGGSRATAAGAVHILEEEGLVAVRDKRVATVRHPDEVEQTPDARLADARSELIALRDDVLDVRRRLDDVTQRVTDALTRLRT